MIASFSLLSGDELLALPRDLTLFLFPIGGLEQHGPHLPLGTKLIEAEELTAALARELQEKLPVWKLILMPILPLTIDSATSKVALVVRPHVVRDAMVDQCDALKRLGFLNFAAISAHRSPRQLTALEDAGRILSKKKWVFFGEKAVFISVSSALMDSKEVWRSPMIALPEEHGGELSTSIVLKVNPNLVHSSFAQLPDLPRPQAGIHRFFDYFKGEINGYWGKPKNGNRMIAEKWLKETAQDLALKLQPVLEKQQGMSYFRSAYRYFPLNGSFFKAYFMASLFFILMLLWVVWSMKDVFDAS